MVNRFWLLSIFHLICISVSAQYRQQTLSTDSTQILYNSAISKPHFQFRQLYIPGALLISGIALNGNGPESFKNEIVEERNEHIPRFRTHIDDFLQFSPILAAYSLDGLGIASKTDLYNRTAILIKGEAAMAGITYIMKKTIHQQRPDGSNYESFPSGHTAQAFAAATFLSEEYKDKFHWMPYAAYGVAASVGTFRMVNNRHYISDVLVGAAIGILSMKASYWTHHYRLTKKQKEAIAYKRYMEESY
ncbi:phosphatase PAP2 family protein [Sphingobacterium spiritivorum]|uniref:PAP2 family protein n=1 Tax=Sphingobacterium spiritivorum ATCC 33861 TaxID=525373 RepID=D7VRD8_SPHSI|nr:phosphatase PAP2 family protein [Sphingobacterium spiritivorum]EFK56339.1 PAP2 family protein [Sphingobacterium spiritivorum ATCC 33861]QQT35577.1 phosphatase PAP2 family protein [Sphingobacterium spiritivorum]WQD32276.1 phosphatase PAP2 family protein [Sphingobacterium spiritivorum]SUJ07292.1 PAP2 (acid phosphatase) superfamily protein [Sphingobacterium spiritivorum]